jgi:hypothetical protein
MIFMNVYVCVLVCMCECVSVVVCLCVCTCHVCLLRVCVRACQHVYMHVRLCACVLVCVCVRVSVCVLVCLCACMLMWICWGQDDTTLIPVNLHKHTISIWITSLVNVIFRTSSIGVASLPPCVNRCILVAQMFGIHADSVMTRMADLVHRLKCRKFIQIIQNIRDPMGILSFGRIAWPLQFHHPVSIIQCSLPEMTVACYVHFVIKSRPYSVNNTTRGRHYKRKKLNYAITKPSIQIMKTKDFQEILLLLLVGTMLIWLCFRIYKKVSTLTIMFKLLGVVAQYVSYAP